MAGDLVACGTQGDPAMTLVPPVSKSVADPRRATDACAVDRSLNCRNTVGPVGLEPTTYGLKVPGQL